MDAPTAEALLAGAVRHRSPSGEEGAVARHLVESMRPWADASEVDEVGNAVGWFGSGALRVALLGHLDTVPGWWPVRVEAGVLHGRGSVDAKGSLCAMIAAATRLSAATRERVSVQVIGAVGEEAGSEGARHATRAYPKPDLVVVGEPSGWDALTLGYKGRLTLRVEIERDEGHGARDEPTAAARAALAWSVVESWARSHEVASAGLFHAVQASLTSIGSTSDGLHQRAHASIGLRLPPALDPRDAEDALRALVAPRLGSDTVRLDFGNHERAYLGPRDGALTRAFRAAIRAEGAQPRHLLKTGTSDMNVVAPVWDVPMVAYGPGDASLDHTPHERLELAEYARSIRVLERVLASVASGVRRPTGRSSCG